MFSSEIISAAEALIAGEPVSDALVGLTVHQACQVAKCLDMNGYEELVEELRRALSWWRLHG